MDLRQYVHALRVHWRAVWVCLLLGVAVGGALTLVTTPVYSATASVFISTSGTGTTDSANLQANSLAEERLPSYAALLTGRNLAQQVINRTGLDMSAGELASSISAQLVPDSFILERR
ncbi:MAG: Wzz/FepE/Etk N-terminal domain-containing protein [Geodermatophilaceae bacterium]